MADTFETNFHVHFGSKAGICSAKRHVRFTPEADISRDIHSTTQLPDVDRRWHMVLGIILPFLDIAPTPEYALAPADVFADREARVVDAALDP